jgi:hypothetical protein
VIEKFGQMFWRLTIIFSLEAIIDHCRASYFYSANKQRIINENGIGDLQVLEVQVDEALYKLESYVAP